MYSEFTPENTVTSEDAERDFEAVLALVDKHHIVLIMRDGKSDLVAMGFHYYLERFGPLLSDDEYRELKALDKVKDNVEKSESPSADESK